MSVRSSCDTTIDSNEIHTSSTQLLTPNKAENCLESQREDIQPGRQIFNLQFYWTKEKLTSNCIVLSSLCNDKDSPPPVNKTML